MIVYACKCKSEINMNQHIFLVVPGGGVAMKQAVVSSAVWLGCPSIMTMATESSVNSKLPPTEPICSC